METEVGAVFNLTVTAGGVFNSSQQQGGVAFSGVLESTSVASEPGPPGPNEITGGTLTPLNGILKGTGTLVAVATPDVDYQRPLTLTTTGTGGAATLSGDTLNIPVYAGFANPMTTVGDTIIGGSAGAPTRLPAGTNGQVLTMVSGSPAWAAATGGMVNPMTTSQDIIVGGSSGTPTRLAVGSNGKVLTVSGGVISWQTPAAGFTNPMTTLGDIITGASGGAAQRVGVGTTGQSLRVIGGAPVWGTGTYFNVMDYGAQGNGTHDDTSAIQACINAALATGNASATVYFPAGNYKITSALVCTSATVSAAGNGVTLRGDGHSASVVVKSGSSFVGVTWNGNGGPNGHPTSYGGLVDISVEGGSTAGGLVQTNSANQMFFRGFSLNGGTDFAMDLNTMQDSYFHQFTSNSVHSASAPIIHIYGSASGNTNQLFFGQMRLEDFYGTAIKIEAGSGNSSTNNGFYFQDMKLETGNVSGDFFVADAATLDLHIKRAFGSANSYKAGYSTPMSMITSAAYQNVSYEDIYFNDGIGGQVAALNVTPNGSDFGIASARNIFYNGTGNTATINFSSTISNMVWTIEGNGTDGSAPVLAGTLPYQLVDLNNGVIGGGSFTGAVALNGGGSIGDATNIALGTGTGTKIGTATTQKLGFYNATPVVQPPATTDLGTVLSNLGLRAAGTAYPITTSGAVTLTGAVAMNATTLATDTTTGLKIGTATTQKLGFYNATPIVQPGATTDLGTVLSNLGLRASGTAYPITTSGAVTLTGAVAMNATTLATDTTTGLKIGTATNQKLAFFNSSPIVQPSGDIITALSNLGLVTSGTISESDVTNLTTDLAGKAPLASPALTGSPTAPTQSFGDNSTKLATTAYVDRGPEYALPAAGGSVGPIIPLTSAQTQAIGDVVAINSSGNATLAKADVIADASGIFLATAAVSGSASNTYLLPGGILRLSSSPSWTKGGLVYLSTTGTTGNTMTQTAPSATNNVIQILGVALTADTLLFAPSLVQVEHT